MLIQFDRPNLRIDSSQYPRHLVLIALSHNPQSSVSCEIDSVIQSLTPTRLHYLDGTLQVQEYAVSFEAMLTRDTVRRQLMEFRLSVNSLYLEDRDYHIRNVQLLFTFPLVGGVGTLTLPTSDNRWGLDVTSSVEFHPPYVVQLYDATDLLNSYRRTHVGRVPSPETLALREWRIANAVTNAEAMEVGGPGLDDLRLTVQERILDDLRITAQERIDYPLERVINPTAWHIPSLPSLPRHLPSLPSATTIRSRFDRIGQEELPSDASLDESSPKSGLPLK